MAQINKPNLHFNTKLYTGNGSTDHAITGVGFQPDLAWVKERSNSDNNILHHLGMNAGDYLSTTTNGQLSNSGEMIKSLNTDGFTLGTRGEVNTNSANYASWNWKGAGSFATNNVGSTTSQVSANTTSGFAIVKWTGTGSATTLGHGLGATPTWIIVKNTSEDVNWMMYARSMIAPGATNKEFFELNQTNGLQANGSATTFTSTSNTTFGVGTDNKVNGSSDNMIAYVFAPIKGFSSFGKYVGNGNAKGPFIYTGFKPAWVLQKQHATRDWTIADNKRANTYNPINARLNPNTNYSEGANNLTDFYSNGFKCRGTETNTNENGGTYMYFAFAESPLIGTNGVPTTAR